MCIHVDLRVVFQTQVSELEWKVPSGSDPTRSYTTLRLALSCTRVECVTRCTQDNCVSLCVHMYSCSCYDAQNDHICKHMHQVHSLYKSSSNPTEIQQESPQHLNLQYMSPQQVSPQYESPHCSKVLDHQPMDYDYSPEPDVTEVLHCQLPGDLQPNLQEEEDIQMPLKTSQRNSGTSTSIIL